VDLFGFGGEVDGLDIGVGGDLSCSSFSVHKKKVLES
jgi:hypothetical protein